jgi:multiple sugar transport system substrate-binding protein
MNDARALARRSGPTRRVALRGLATAGAAGAAGALLGACGATGGGESGAGAPQLTKNPVTVTAFVGITDIQVNRFPDEVGAPFKAKFPNVTLVATPQTGAGTQGVMERLTSFIAAGNPPDIFEGPRYPDVMVGKGFIEESMDAMVKRDKYKTDAYNPKEFAVRAQLQGKTVQMPWKLGGNSLLVLLNTELFQASGVPLPATDLSKAWTWEEWVQAAVRLTKRSGSAVGQFGHNGLAWTIGSWPLLWQTDWISNDLKTVTCDTTDMVDCYTRLLDLHYKHQVVPLPGQAAELWGTANPFLTGKAAMQMVSVGGWPTYVNATPQVQMTAVPVPKVKISTPCVNAHAMAIVKGSKAQAEAWESIKFMIEDARLPILTERMPARLDHLEPFVKDTVKATPRIETKLVLDVARNFVPQTAITRHPAQDAMLDAINPQLNELWKNAIAPGPMLKGLKAQLETLIQQR